MRIKKEIKPKPVILLIKYIWLLITHGLYFQLVYYVVAVGLLEQSSMGAIFFALLVATLFVAVIWLMYFIRKPDKLLIGDTYLEFHYFKSLITRRYNKDFLVTEKKGMLGTKKIIIKMKNIPIKLSFTSAYYTF